VSLADLLINTAFAILGAAISAGLALWIEVYDVAERIRTRNRGRPHFSHEPEDTRGSQRLLPEFVLNGFEVLGLLLEVLWELRYFLLVSIALVTGPWWLESLLKSLGASDQVAAAALVGNLVAAFGFFSWVLTDTRPSTSIGRRLHRSLTLTLTLLACVAVAQVALHSALLQGGMCLIFAWGAQRSWNRST
jgi:hypothetical protein